MMIRLLFVFACSAAFQLHAQVSPFIATTWNQVCYYNDSCPAVSSGGACGKAYTGCNATAMAMICKYYAYPATGFGSHCNSNLPSQCVNFAAQNYNYAAMPNNVTGPNADVAQLMAHLGAACDMQYSGISSNSFFGSEVLKRYYRYSPRLYSSATFLFNTTQELIDAIKLELDAGRPVYCKGGNHFYLIDGYNSSSQFHVNFGWGGLYNGYYAITSVTNAQGNFTPSNFMFMIRPLAGDLETAADTITVTAGAPLTTLEFSSTLPWTITTSVSWITPALTSGSAGYFSYSDGSTFTPQVNNGAVRYGYIYVQNANDTDTVVIKQEASPLTAAPDTLSYTASGGTLVSNITYFSWGGWTTSNPFAWITVSPASGTGNATPSITCSLNVLPAPRNGYVVVNAGIYSDTIFVWQDGSITTALSQTESPSSFTLYPNPANSEVTIQRPENTRATLFVRDLAGREVYMRTVSGNVIVLDISPLPRGVYLLELRNEEGRGMTKLVVE
ncbi:MAG: C10 family peptidase [Bacteroidetes bacterium]|nr:C10 family peptidase [Bacteroidota bacterium]